jgi:hypothetical protein
MKSVNVMFVTAILAGGLCFANDASKKSDATGATGSSGASGSSGSAGATGTGSGGSSMGAGNMAMGSSPAEKLSNDMRKLWSEHAFWLRNVIIATVASQPDQKAATDRLMKNQDEIGNAMGTYYGKSAGEQLSKLLKEHETIGAEVVMAARDGKKTQQQDADKRWHANAQQISELLAKWNPNWSKESMTEMMNKHLSTTTEEVKARVDKKWDEDVKAFDTAYEQVLDMADDLSQGIVKQFPEKFSQKLGKR